MCKVLLELHCYTANENALIPLSGSLSLFGLHSSLSTANVNSQVVGFALLA